jgi:hypothetical protein
MKKHYGIIVFALIGTLNISAQTNRHFAKISIRQAHKLVMTAMSPDMASLPGLFLDEYTISACPDFYYFAVLWNNPMPEGSNLSTHIAVDSLTGEVWNPFLTIRYESKKLNKLQHVIRKSLRLSDDDYKKLRERYPC